MRHLGEAQATELAERIEDAIDRGEYSAELQEALEAAGRAGVEELCDAIRRWMSHTHGARKSERYLQYVMLDTPTGRAWRERFVADQLAEANNPEPEMPWER